MNGLRLRTSRRRCKTSPCRNQRWFLTGGRFTERSHSPDSKSCSITNAHLMLTVAGLEPTFHSPPLSTHITFTFSLRPRIRAPPDLGVLRFVDHTSQILTLRSQRRFKRIRTTAERISSRARAHLERPDCTTGRPCGKMRSQRTGTSSRPTARRASVCFAERSMRCLPSRM